MKKILLFSIIILSIICIGCTVTEDPNDQIKLNIQLDVDEDIGLLIINHTINDYSGSGGIANADKSKLDCNSLLDFTFDRQLYGNPEGPINLTLQFAIITEYYEPNYDNDYPEEDVMYTNELTFTAEFGKTYNVVITGNKLNGYQFNLNGEGYEESNK